MRTLLVLVLLAACGKGSGDPPKATPRVSSCVTDGTCQRTGACEMVTSGGTVDQFGSKPGELDIQRGTSKCAPTKREHCAASDACKQEGLCSLGSDACVVGSDAECRASKRCSDLGQCRKDPDHDWNCVADSDADCAASLQCKERGFCVAVKSSGGTVEYCGPANAAACKQAPACLAEGACTFMKNGRGADGCFAKTDADCTPSEACSKEGRCRSNRATNPECVK